MKQMDLISMKRITLYLCLVIFWCCFSFTNPSHTEAASQSETVSQPETAKPAEKTDNDKLISITLKETDIREVLNILSFKGGVNIVAGDDVVAKISVQLKDVPWEQALDVILKTYNFTYKREGNLIRVMSLARALEEEGKTPLKTRILALNFADVDKLKESLSKMLSKRGTMEVDKRTNSLIITDIPEMVDAIEVSATRLDTLTPQVLIEAMMVDIKITNDNKWGALLNFTDNKSQGNSNQLKSNLSDSSITTVFNFGAVTNGFSVNGVIDTLVGEGLASILANPKVLTLDNQEAMIQITTEIPYSESVDSGSGVTTTIKFKDAGIKLAVTPHITSGQFISMNVKPEQSFQSGFAEGTTQPIIDTRKAETNLLVKDGQTIVIGGLRQSTDNLTNQKFPVLGDVPFLGLFFRSKIRTKQETELVIFVTPHIIETSLLSDKELELFNKLDNTAHLTVDDRSEMDRLRDFMKKSKDVEKAKKIEAQETTRKRVQGRRPVSSINTSDEQSHLESTASEREQGPVVTKEVSPDTSHDDLDAEAAKFRESMNNLKREY